MSHPASDPASRTAGPGHPPVRAAHPSKPGRIPPAVVWFAVLGGPAAWGVHLFVAWSVLEIACLGIPGAAVHQRGGEPGTTAWSLAWGGTLLPAAAALGSVLACWWVSRRRRSAGRDGAPAPDVLAEDRLGLLLVLGWFLSVMSVVAIAAGAVAMLVLEPCG